MRTFIFIFALAIHIPEMVSAQVLTDGLIFLYNFSGSAADSSGNVLHGSVNGATLITDRFGNENAAFYLDGINDYIEIPNSPLVQISYPVSFSLFVKAESFLQTDGRFLNTEFMAMDYTGFDLGLGASVDGRIALGYGGGNGQTNVTNRRGKVSEGSITLDEWHHVAGVIRAPTDMDIYIDCVDAGGNYSGSGPIEVANSGLPGRFGSAPPNPITSATHFLGSLDQVAMWNRALTAGDISKICENDLEPVLPSSIPYHKTKNKFSITYSNAGRSINIACN
ncbi:MAG: hypothetical protein ACI9YU_001309, partial [Flavobacteriales bacterium]